MESFAEVRLRSQSRAGANAFWRARPLDSSKVIPASEFVSTRWRCLGMEEDAHANEPQPLLHARSRIFEGISIHHQVETGAPCSTGKGRRMDVAIEEGGLRDATASGYRN